MTPKKNLGLAEAVAQLVESLLASAKPQSIPSTELTKHSGTHH